MGQYCTQHTCNSGADPGFLERGFIRGSLVDLGFIRGLFVDFISIFLNIP